MKGLGLFNTNCVDTFPGAACLKGGLVLKRNVSHTEEAAGGDKGVGVVQLVLTVKGHILCQQNKLIILAVNGHISLKKTLKTRNTYLRQDMQHISSRI